MVYIYSIILAAIQALTEFLPISSSGHLVIAHQILKSPLLNSLTFDVILHLGTLLALLIYFWTDVVKLIKGFFTTVVRFKISNNFYEQLPWLIIVGTIPAAVAGFFWEDLLEQFFRSINWVIIALAAGSLLFILFEKISAKRRYLESMTLLDALAVGLAQILAFIPGMSRSGMTIVAGLGLGFKRADSAKFSFLLSMPIIFGAAIRKITQISLSDFSLDFIFVSILGTAVAALFGYLVIKYLLKFLAKHSLMVFAWYRLLLAAVLAVMFLL